MSHKATRRLAAAAIRPHQTARTACTPRSLCARCALVKVIGYRIDLFARNFGRLPETTEPIFFVTRSAKPFAAPREEFLRQLSEAAQRLGLRLAPLQRLLRIEVAEAILSNLAQVESSRASDRHAGPAKSASPPAAFQGDGCRRPCIALTGVRQRLK